MAENILEKFNKEQLSRSVTVREIPAFQAGDTVRVNVRIIEGDAKTQRIQAFEGLCIARRNRGVNSAFTVRKISHGEGVERVFPSHSPLIDSVVVVRKGIVRRAKLYYMRDLTGKAARITEKREYNVSSSAEKRNVASEAPQAAESENNAN